MTSAGWYKLDTGGALLHSPTTLTGPGWDRGPEDREPVDGWAWYDSQADAESALLSDANSGALAARIEAIAANAVTLGMALAVEAGVTPQRAAEVVAEVTGAAPAPLLDGGQETTG